jgi:hypothetical protein
MNPILAVFLAVFVVSLALTLIHLTLVHFVTIDIATATDFQDLSYEEVEYEVHKRWLGRVGEVLHPVAFWWLYAFAFIYSLTWRNK